MQAKKHPGKAPPKQQVVTGYEVGRISVSGAFLGFNDPLRAEECPTQQRTDPRSSLDAFYDRVVSSNAGRETASSDPSSQTSLVGAAGFRA